MQIPGRWKVVFFGKELCSVLFVVLYYLFSVVMAVANALLWGFRISGFTVIYSVDRDRQGFAGSTFGETRIEELEWKGKE